ncbi:MAG: porin [Campylobacterota bacterium]|nr:porin [Campylobacterota bacterium]
MNRVAVVGRLDYTGINGLLLGASGYYGDAAQGDPSGSKAFIYDAHLSYENSGFKFKGLYTATTVEDAQKWNEALAATDASGYYLNAEYDLLSFISTPQRLPLFAQYESYNTTEKIVSGDAPDNELSITTVGLNYYPHDQVVLKLDYAMKDYSSSSKEDIDTLSFGLGFVF